MALVWASLELIAGAREWVFPTCAYGTCPMISSKGDFPVAAFGQALCVYWASGSHLAQSICALFPNIRRYCSNHWLVCSDCPSVWGWYAEDMFRSMSRRWQSSLVKVVVKQGSLSDITFLGRP